MRLTTKFAFDKCNGFVFVSGFIWSRVKALIFVLLVVLTLILIFVLIFVFVFVIILHKTCNSGVDVIRLFRSDDSRCGCGSSLLFFVTIKYLFFFFFFVCNESLGSRCIRMCPF